MFEKQAKFTIFCNFRHKMKKLRKKSKFCSHRFLGNIVVNISAKYHKHLPKTGGAYSICIKVDGRTDGRRTDDGRLSIG